MTVSIDNHQLRAALLDRGFEDITSADRLTKSWRLRHPDMENWVSIKLATDTRRPMSKAPLVAHPEDAERIASATSAHPGIVFEDAPYQGSSTKYADDKPGWALSLADESAVDAFVEAALNGTSGSSLIDPVIWAAAAEDIDAGLRGRVVTATTRTQLIEARVGQGRYRTELLRIWQRRCAVTGCSVEKALIASHAIPWRDNKDPETCLDRYNGLLLTASIDKLFDQGLFAFADDGRLLQKPGVAEPDLAHLGLTPDSRLRADCLDPRHLPYLRAHRARHRF